MKTEVTKGNEFARDCYNLRMEVMHFFCVWRKHLKKNIISDKQFKKDITMLTDTIQKYRLKDL